MAAYSHCLYIFMSALTSHLLCTGILTYELLISHSALRKEQEKWFQWLYNYFYCARDTTVLSNNLCMKQIEKVQRDVRSS